MIGALSTQALTAVTPQGTSFLCFMAAMFRPGGVTNIGCWTLGEY